MSTHPRETWDRLGPDEVAVVVGTYANTIPEYQHHPRVVFWPTNEVMRRTLPSKAGLVMMTRFVSHQQSNYTRMQAKKQGVRIVPWVLNYGEVHRELDRIFKVKHSATTATITTATEATMDVQQHTKTDVAMVPPQKGPQPKAVEVPQSQKWLQPKPGATWREKDDYRSALWALLRPHVDLTKPTKDEAPRLAALAREHGFPDADALRVGKMIGRRRQLAQAPTSTTVSVPQTRAVRGSDNPTVQMLSDVMVTVAKALGDTQVALKLAKESVAQAMVENTELRKTISKMKGLLGS